MHDSSVEGIFIGRESGERRTIREKLHGNAGLQHMRQLDLPVRFRFSCILLHRALCLLRTNADDAMTSIEVKLQSSAVFIIMVVCCTVLLVRRW
eukprot:scaffold37876_cov188-Skeletonema_marinoi.AAC.3